MSVELVFNKDLCIICHTFHVSGADKAAHIEGEPHKKKQLIQDFIVNEIGDVDPQNSDLNSLLSTRRLRSGVVYLGAENIVELRVNNQEHDRFWICKVCNVADRTLDSVDSHLYSSEHVHNTWRNTNHPDNQNASWFDRFQEQIRGCPENEVWNEELKLILEFVHLYGPSFTTAFNYPFSSSEVLARQLQITSPLELQHADEEVHDNHNVVCCLECFNIFYKRKDAKSTVKCWNEHLATPAHQEALFFNSYLNQIRKERKEGYPPSLVPTSSFDFILDPQDGVAYGPTIGLEHCIVFEAEAVCTLCFCVVPENNLEKHFSSERHCENFLRSYSPSTFVNCEFEILNDRRASLSAVLNAFVDKQPEIYHFEASIPLPSIFWKISKPENRKLETSQVKKCNITGSVVFVCDICKICFRKSTIKWESHIESVEHFDKMIEWQSVQRDERSFLIIEPNLPKFNRKRHFQWTDNSGIQNVQNYCEFGMDLIFYDILEKSYVCTCCYKEFPDDQKDRMHLHVRTLKHIQSALCVINPDFAAELLTAKSETELKALVSEYLKFNPAIKIPQKIREFNPLRAFHLNYTKQIPRVLLRLSETEFTLREGYMRENRIQLTQKGEFKTKDDTDCVSMTTALQMTNLVLIKIDAKEMIFHCLDCQLSFSVFLHSAESIWTEHLLTELHWKRMSFIQQSQLDLTKLMDEPSRYQPKIVEQIETDGKKKLTWSWDPESETYQLIVQNKLIFDEVAHREHFNGMTSFFCSLCCESFELSEHALTGHVFGFKHLLFYVIKYFPEEVNTLECLLLESSGNVLSTRETIRSFIAEKLRSSEVKNSKVRCFDGRTKIPQRQNLQDFLDKEPTSFHVLRACKAVKIDNLMLTKDFSFATLHNLCPTIPEHVGLRTKVYTHLTLKNLLDPSIKDIKPEQEEDWIKPLPTPTIQEKRAPEIIGPVVSKVILGKNGIPIVIDTPVVNLPAIAPVPAPVIAPVPPPQNIVPIKIETSPMEISDDDEPKSRRNAVSPTQNRRSRRSPSPQLRKYRERQRSRSRSPNESRGRRSYQEHSPIDSRGRRSYREHSPEIQSWRSEQPRRFKEDPDLEARSWRSQRSDSVRDDREMNYRIKRLPSPMYPLTPPQEVRARTYSQLSSPPLRRFREDSEIESSRNENQSMTTSSVVNAPKVIRPPPGVDEDVYVKNLRHQVDITPKTHVMPPIDLTKPPPQILGTSGLPAMSIPPPGLIRPPQAPPPAHYVPGLGPPPYFPAQYGMPPLSQYNNPPPPLPGQMQVPTHVEPQIDLQTKGMILRVNLFNRDLESKNTREQLLSYLKMQGQDPIPESDPLLLFNEVIRTKKNIIGADFLSQIVCFQDPDYETYLCTLCDIWTTVSDMFRHLRSTLHRVNYLQKRFLSRHASYLCLENEAEKNNYLEETARKIFATEGSKQCKTRMRCILTRNTIERIWPDVDVFIDNSWKITDDDEVDLTLNILTTGQHQQPINDANMSRNSDRDRDRERHNDRERERSDRERRDRDRKRSPGRDERKYSSNRDSNDERRRSKSPRSRSRTGKSEIKRSPSPKRPTTPLWEKQTHIFSDTIERLAVRPNLDVDEIDRSRNEKLLSLKESSKTTSIGFQQLWENNFREPTNPTVIEERKMSAAEKRMVEQQIEKKKREGFQKKLSALVLIRQEAVEYKRYDRETINRICEQTNVSPDDVLQEEIIEEAGKIIGEDSVYVLMAVAYHYHHPLQPPPKVLQEPPIPEKNPHAATLLAGIGMDKSEIANLLKKVAMAKQTSITGERNLNETEVAKRKKNRRGGVKERMRREYMAYRNRMIAAGLDPDEYDGEMETIDDYDEPSVYPDPYGRLPQLPGLPQPTNVPPQLPENYQGPVGVKKIRPNPLRPIRRYEPEPVYDPSNDYYPQDYMYQYPPVHRPPGPSRQTNPMRSATGANAVPVLGKGGPRMPSSTTGYSGADPSGSLSRPKNPPQSQGYNGSFVSDYDYYASDYGNERQFFTAPPKPSAAPPPPKDEDSGGDWDAAASILHSLFK